MKRLLLVSIAMFCVNQAFAYDCNQSAKYKKEYEVFARIPPVDMKSLMVGDAFLIERKHLTPKAANDKMLKIIQQERSPLLMRLESKLDDVIARMKSAKPTNEEECLGLIELRHEHRRIGQQMTKYTVAKLIASEPPAQPSSPKCKSQKLPEGHVSEICLVEGAMFDHSYFTLRIDALEIFRIADDYAEEVELRHKISRNPSIEFPLSLQGPTESTIRGGCTPVAKNGVLTAHICNFTWGDIQIVKDVRFDL